jgi:hypothetical protein
MPPTLRLRQQEAILFRRSLFFVGALMLLRQSALAAEPAKPCVDLKIVRDEVTARNGKLTELTQGEWQFLRGIYAMNLEGPFGLPYGDRAVLAKVDGRSDGLVLFVDGDQACTPMHAPPELLLLMHEIATGAIHHQKAGL